MDIGALFSSPDWGTVPDWLAAVGTISAVCVALAFGFRDSKRLHIERMEAAEDRKTALIERQEAAKDRERFREQQEAEAAEKKRRLASRVSLNKEVFIDDIGERKLLWKIHNGGDEPISWVVARVQKSRPGDLKTRDTYKLRNWSSIEAGGTRTHTSEVFESGIVGEGQLLFTDGSGLRWQRGEYGSLKLSPQLPPGPEGLA